MKYFFCLLIGWMQCGLACALGVDAPAPSPTAPFNHRAFTSLDGAPRSVNSLAQTTDGTLWVGSSVGLSRFDGIRFVEYPTPSDDPLPVSDISTLMASPDGGLWVGYLRGGASFLKNGRATNFRPRTGYPRGTTLAFALDPQHNVWVATTTEVARLNGEKWETQFAIDDPREQVRMLLIDRQGTQWIASYETVWARAAGESHYREVTKKPLSQVTGRVALVQGPDGGIWVALAHDLMRVRRTGESSTQSELVVEGYAGKPFGPTVFDREGNLWTSAGGLLRLPAGQLGRPDGRAEPEKLAPREMSHANVAAMLQDREGNMWVGTRAGLDRFTPGSMLAGPADCVPRAFAPGDAGTLWIVCDAGSGTVESRDANVLTRHATPQFTTMHRDTEGTIWAAAPGVLSHVENGRFVSQPLPAEAGNLPLQSLLRDANGAVWVSTSHSTFRLRNGVWSRNAGLDHLPARGATAMALASDESVWLGYGSSGRLARVKDDNVQWFDAKDGLAVGQVMSISARSGEVWVGGDRGLARLDGARFMSIVGPTAKAFDGISGIVRTKAGDLWLNGSAGFSHIARRSIDDAIRDPLHRASAETFNGLDGVRGTAPRLRLTPSVVEATDGRIWFATSAGIQSVDADRFAHNTLPPPVTIWALTSGERRYRDAGESIPLPENTRSVQIEYGAGSLTVPERIRFRHRLDGLDQDWQDAGTRREASYTNLGPGGYRFRVIASNNDGVWNETGSSLAFTIAPAYYQTRWFHALCAFAFLLLLFALYRLRVRQVSAQIRGRLEARLAERERISRELHDTLLQGVQGLILRFQAATDRIPHDEPARDLMEKSLDRADKLLAESRDKVKDLRPSAGDARTLEQALAIEGAQFAELHPAAFRISVQGAHRGLHPLVHEESFLIAREALANALQHSRADNVEIELTYGDEALQISIRDDGEGIDAALLAAGGRPGHFGLIGMRERAGKLGAQVQVWSKAGAGAEIELRVPATIAYLPARPKRDGLRSRLGAWRARRHPEKGGIDQAETST